MDHNSVKDDLHAAEHDPKTYLVSGFSLAILKQVRIFKLNGCIISIVNLFSSCLFFFLPRVARMIVEAEVPISLK